MSAISNGDYTKALWAAPNAFYKQVLTPLFRLLSRAISPGVASAAALRAAYASTDCYNLMLTNVAGVLYYYSSASTASDDGTTVIRPGDNPTAGRWLAVSVGGSIADGSVTAAKLATDAVENAKIKDKAVTSAKIADNGVDSVNINANCVTAAKLALGALRGGGFAGKNGTGACTLPGAKVGDKVWFFAGLNAFSGAETDFESTITVADQIQQTSVDDLSGGAHLVILLARGA